MTDRYRWARGEELAQRWGAEHSAQILFFEPLFEEKNRTRRLIGQIAQALDALEIGLIVPDLPGTGESLVEIDRVSLADWQNAASSAITQFAPDVIALMRGGVLIDCQSAALPIWRFAPETGARLVRDLRRTQLTGEGTKLYAGNALSDKFLTELEAISPPPIKLLRTVRLENDAAEADARVSGNPLWRRAEPGEDKELALSLAADLAGWMRTCAAS